MSGVASAPSRSPPSAGFVHAGTFTVSDTRRTVPMVRTNTSAAALTTSAISA